MSLVTTHCSGASARRSRYTVMGSLTVGQCAVKSALQTRRRGAYVVVTARNRGGLWEGFEAEPPARFFLSLPRRFAACRPSTLSHRRLIECAPLADARTADRPSTLARVHSKALKRKGNHGSE
jgi:hypothetical protein